MAFSQIPKIESYQFYLDLAIKRAQKKLSGTSLEGKYLDKIKKREELRLQIVYEELKEKIVAILKSFPSFDSLTPFYDQLTRITIDVSATKKSLGALQWAKGKLQEFTHLYKRKIKNSREKEDLEKHKKEFFGRITSVLKQVKNDLELLEHARYIIREYPTIKSNIFTLCICGFPNVGKSTLLSKITTATPEIADYSFTTKQLNLGYTAIGHNKIQVIDTPGTLNRIDKMNAVEQQAYLVMKYVADVIVYVFDFSTQSTADGEDQKKLFQVVLDYQKPILCYIGKADLLTSQQLNTAVQTIKLLVKEVDIVDNSQQLMEKLNKYVKTSAHSLTK